MTEDDLSELFKELFPKLKNKFEKLLSPVPHSEDTFVFSIQNKHNKHEDVPTWTKELRSEINEIKARMESNESGFREDHTVLETP